MGEEGGPSLLSASARVSCGRLRFRVNAILRPDTRQLLLWIEQRQSSPARNWLSHPWERSTLLAVGRGSWCSSAAVTCPHRSSVIPFAPNSIARGRSESAARSFFATRQPVY